MRVGTVREIKEHEYRVGLTPDCVKAYVNRGHEVFVEAGAGESAGFADSQYKQAGAAILADNKAVFDTADMIVKVKEPLPAEYGLFREGQTLYTYLHLAADKALAEALLAANIKAIAYETIETADGGLPCLKPMSEIAGRLAIQEGAKYLEKPFGGSGILLGGVPGVKRGKIAILGGGISGTNACKMAVGIGADVTVLDINSNRLAYLDDIFGSAISTLYCTDANIERVLKESDLVIGAVLIPGSKTPHLVKKQHLSMMKKGSVIVDISVDQGGCIETTRPTYHSDPVFVVDGVVHYCVANMPGAVALTSTLALTGATLRYGLILAENGFEKACRMSKELALGANLYMGKCVYKGVAESLDIPYTLLESVI